MAHLPMPDVPALDANNSLDADAVVTALESWVLYPGIEFGDWVRIDFRGCGLDGTPSDELSIDRQIDQLDPDKGYQVPIPAEVITPLKGGWVFYGYYRIDFKGTPRETAEPSLRRFFYVNRVISATGGLPVMSLKPSHDLVVVPSELEGRDADMLVLPYQAMAEGDKIEFSWRVIEDDGTEWDAASVTYEVKAEDVGLPVVRQLPRATIESAQGINIELKYRITYIGNGASSESPTQVRRVEKQRPTPSPELPAPRIQEVPGVPGEVVIIDPDLWPDGVTVEVEPYPGMAHDDVIALYLQDDRPQVEALGTRLDLTSVQSGRLAFRLQGDWLRARGARDLALTYQCDRPDYEARSEALAVSVSTKLVLPAPSVKDAVPKDEPADHDGAIDGWVALDKGSEIRLPQDLGLPTDTVYKAYWAGHTATGSGDFDLAPGQTVCAVPGTVIPANLSRVVRVYYSVSLDGKRWQNSDVYRLLIDDKVTPRLPTIQVQPVQRGNVSLAAVPAEGLKLIIGFWKGMLPGQLVTLEVHGLVNGANKVFYPRERVPVTQAERDSASVVGHFEKSLLQTLDLNTDFEVRGSVSFDEGDSFKPFTTAQLVITP